MSDAKRIGALFALFLVALGGCVGDPNDVEDAPAEALGQAQQAFFIDPTGVRRGAAAVEVNRDNGGQELWVVVCSDELVKFRLKKTNGRWSSWVNTNAPCTAAPSLAVWRTATSPEVPVAYYRNNNDLMEITFTATNAWQVVNLSKVTGFGALHVTGDMDPLVTYFDAAKKQIALLAWRASDDYLYSVDFYSGRWHYKKVVGQVPGVARMAPWFSKETGENSYFSYPIGLLHVVFHRADIVDAYAPWKVLADTNTRSPHLVTFGGPPELCEADGCVLTLNEQDSENVRYAPLTPGDPDWTQQWLLGYEWRAPVGRQAGDATIVFSFGGIRSSSDQNALYMIDFKTNGIVRADAWSQPSGAPNSMPVLPVNVYRGSQYEHDVFFTVNEAAGRELYYASYDATYNSWTFTDMGVDVLFAL